MIMTILEASVLSDGWATLQKRFEGEIGRLPPQIAYSYLNQDTNNPTSWQIVTIWHSRKALDNYRQSVETPEGVVMFREVNAEPKLFVFEVVVAADGMSER